MFMVGKKGKASLGSFPFNGKVSLQACIKLGYHSKGFTLVEVMAVVVILGILMAIASVSVINSIEKAKREVCFSNTQQLERHYEAYLISDGNVHSNRVFMQYMKEYGEDICPDDGEISYEDGKVHCSLHPWDEEGGNDGTSEEGVPYL